MEKRRLPVDEIKNVLSENYASIVQRKIVKIENVQGNEKNSHNYIVYTTKGKYLARRQRALTKENAKVVLGMIRFCSEQGVKVPMIVHNDHNSAITTYKGDFFTIFEFIEGSEFKGSSYQITAVAQEVARLHRALKVYNGRLPEHKNSTYDENYYGNLREEELKQVKTLITEEDFNFIKQEMKEQKRAWIDVRKNDLLIQPIHRDLHPKNVLFQGNDVAAILDFDAVKEGMRIVDVGFCGFRFAGKELPLFMEVYNTINPLRKEEQNVVVLAVREEFLRRINYILHDLLNGKRTWFSSLNSHLDSIKTLRKMELEMKEQELPMNNRNGERQ